jgi:plasmid stability protein
MLALCLHQTSHMPTLTIRNVPVKVVRSLKALARRRRRSMEQEVRELLEAHVAERRSVLEQIEAGWGRQRRRPGAHEIDSWIGVGRP